MQWLPQRLPRWSSASVRAVLRMGVPAGVPGAPRRPGIRGAEDAAGMLGSARRVTLSRFEVPPCNRCLSFLGPTHLTAHRLKLRASRRTCAHVARMYRVDQPLSCTACTACTACRCVTGPFWTDHHFPRAFVHLCPALCRPRHAAPLRSASVHYDGLPHLPPASCASGLPGLPGLARDGCVHCVQPHSTRRERRISDPLTRWIRLYMGARRCSSFCPKPDSMFWRAAVQ